MKLAIIVLSAVIGLSACDAYAGDHTTAAATQATPFWSVK